MAKVLQLFQPAPNVDRLPTEKIKAKNKKLHWQIFVSIIIGYIIFYLIPNNPPHLELHDLTKIQLGLTGFLKYVNDTITGNTRIVFIGDHFGWDNGFITFLSSSILSIVFYSLSRKQKFVMFLKTSRKKN